MGSTAGMAAVANNLRAICEVVSGQDGSTQDVLYE
jgi:hypothetical protein